MSSAPSTSKSANTTGSTGLREHLKRNGLIIDDDGALERCPIIMEIAEKVISAERHSVMKPASVKNIRKARKREENSNEATIIDHVWRKIIKEYRHPEERVEDTGNDGSEVTKEEQDTLYLRSWEADELHYNRDDLFQINCIPPLSTEDNPALEDMLKTLPKVTNPKPDIAYGLLQDTFTKEEDTINYEYRNCTEISKGQYHTFFIIEFKAKGGTIEEAENQACRGGAALVHGMRTFKAKANLTDINPGEKSPCIAFSMATIPKMAEFFVHWAETVGQTTLYHMNKVGDSYRLDSTKDLIQLRRDIDNVLDWGSLTRKREIQGFLKTIGESKKPKEKPKTSKFSKAVSVTISAGKEKNS